MSENVSNLDGRCAQSGYELVKGVASNGRLPRSDKAKLENTITKSLGVLQENGVYALFLYLEYRLKETGASQAKRQALDLLRHMDVGLLEQNGDHFDAVRRLTEDLDSLLMARKLLEQMLVYARYHAKALEEQE